MLTLESNCSQCGKSLNERPLVHICYHDKPCKYGHQQSTIATSELSSQFKSEPVEESKPDAPDFLRWTLKHFKPIHKVGRKIPINEELTFRSFDSPSIFTAEQVYQLYLERNKRN
jgi:hypothetical protein